MSYSDYSNYQQPSGFDSTGGFSSTYTTQGSYDSTQYGNSDQFSTAKDHYSQYDYTSYSSGYQQPADTSTSADYYSSTNNDYGVNSNSYSQQSYGQQASSSGFDSSSGYQSSSYQYSSSVVDQDSTMPVASQDYSSNTGAIGYDYSTATTNYTDPPIDRYEQTTSSYTFGTDQNNSSTTGFSNPSYDSQQSYSQQQLSTSSYSSSQQYSKPSNDYSQTSDFGGYHSTSDGTPSGSFQSTSQNRSSGYQPTTQRSVTDAGQYQSTQQPSSGGYRQNNTSGSGTTGGFRSTQSYNSSGYDDGGFGGYSGPAPGYNQNRKSDVWNSTSSSSAAGSSSASGYYKKPEESFGGFSYNPKREHSGSSFTQHGGSNFSGMDDNFSSQGSSTFSQQGGRGNKFYSNNYNNNNTNTFNQRGGSGNRGSPITARNMGSQSRMNYNQMSNDNTRPMNSGGSWRGQRGGGPQNRGGFGNNGWSDPMNNRPSGDSFNNRSSPRGGGGKFNNFGPRDNDNKGFSDRGGSQFHMRNQNSFNNNRDFGKSKQPVASGPAAGSVSVTKKNEPLSRTTQADSGHQGAFHTNIAKKTTNKDDSGSKAPFYPNQKLLNEVESKAKTKQSTPATTAAPTTTGAPAPAASSKIKEMTQDVRKELEAKKPEEKKTNKTPVNNKTAEQAQPKILAPPKKAPETPEEIAREEEIQKKILASIVVLDPEKEKSLLNTENEKKLTEVEMSEELRSLLQTLTTEHFCKLCNVRLASPQMSAHYNGKNHLKKVRIFAQTNGRSAGFNTETSKNEDSDKSKTDEEMKKEEEEEMDEKKYCKICKVSFLQDGQSEIHYKGKNHAKKLRQANKTDIFECKICSVVVSSQEVLTAHLNGAPHKLQIRKMEGDNPHRGGLQGRGGHRGGGRGGGGRGGFVEGGDGGFRGRGISRGRGRGMGGGGGFFRGFKRPTDSFNFGGSFDKRPRFTNYS